MASSSDRKRLLYFGPSGIGDWCFIYPSLVNLIKAYKLTGATIVIPRKNPGNSLLLENPLIQRVIYLHRETRWPYIPLYGIKWFFKLLRIIKEKGDIVAISYLSNQPDSLLLALLSGATIRIGRYMKGSFLEKMAITHPIYAKGDEGRLTIHNYYVPEVDNKEISSDIPPLFPSILFKNASQIVTSFGLTPQKYIVLGIGGGRAASWRFWPARYYKKIIKLLPSQKFVLLGGGLDDKKQAIAMSPLPLNAIDLVDRTSMKEAIKIISKAAIVIGNDSGIANIASTLGIPTICIYGPTSPKLTGPALLGAHALSPTCMCSPCFLDDQDATKARKCRKRKCLQSITPEQVLKILRNYL